MTTRMPHDFEELLNRLTADVDKLRRRNAPSSVIEILGSGFSELAVEIDDWNTVVVNGQFYSEPGARHSPDPMLRWTGTAIAKDNGSGMQQVWNTDDLGNVLYRMRTYVDAGTNRSFSDWRSFATNSGYIEFDNLEPSLQDTIDDLAAAIDTIPAPLKVYRQTTAPTNPDTDGRPLVVGDQWLDTDDSFHAYIWDGTAWIDYATYVLGDIQAQIDAATATAEAAADAAGDAADFAETLNKVYRTSGEPTNPDADGRALVENDIWFDPDDGDAAYSWDGAAWFPIYLTTQTGSSAVLTGGLVQTEATAARGIKITSAGLTGYNSSGVTKITINAATGVLTSAGGIFTAGDISGSTVTGGTVQSESTAARGIKMNSSALVGYDGAGVAKFSLDASTGVLTLVGGLLSGGTITGPVLQTTGTAARGIKILTTGLTAYDGSGTATLVVDASTGSVVMLGSLTTGSSIDGAVITGGTFRTEATTGRGIVANSSGLVMYAPSPTTAGTARFVLDATTGNVTLTGSMTGGGTITGPVFQTATSGQRIVVNPSNANSIRYYSGHAYEIAPGELYVNDQAATGGRDLGVILSSPWVHDTVANLDRVASLTMVAFKNATTGVVETRADFSVDKMAFLGAGGVTITGVLNVTNHIGALGDIYSYSTVGTGDAFLANSNYAPNAAPSAAGSIALFPRRRGRRTWNYMDENSVSTVLETSFSHHRKVMVGASVGTGTLNFYNTAAPSAVTSPALGIIGTTNYRTRRVRVTHSTSSTAGNTTGMRGPAQAFYLSSTANDGGFYYVHRFGIAAAATGSRGFLGLYANTAGLLGTTEPSAFVSMIGLGWDAADTQFQFMVNDASGSATKIACGANFVKSAVDEFYELVMYAPPGGGSSVKMSIVRLRDGAYFDNSDTAITTNLPAIDAGLNWYHHFTNGTSASVVSIDFQQLVIETTN